VAADDTKIAELSARSVPALAYQDGGMHPSFRALLAENGDTKLAEKVSDIKYPISRPAAALADPFPGGD
jgi:hypothetical protein